MMYARQRSWRRLAAAGEELRGPTMDGENLTYTAQWIGLVGTLLGTALGVGSVVVAWIAASRAKGAREAAESAREAAVRLGRIAQLSDLIGDMQELQTMLAREDLAAIAGNANHLRGRIVRLASETYTELVSEGTEKGNLDAAREQLDIIVKAATGDANQEHKIGKIQRGYGEALEAINKVVGRQTHLAQGD